MARRALRLLEQRASAPRWLAPWRHREQTHVAGEQVDVTFRDVDAGFYDRR